MEALASGFFYRKQVVNRPPAILQRAIPKYGYLRVRKTAAADFQIYYVYAKSQVYDAGPDAGGRICSAEAILAGGRLADASS
jgi:hypothetical protein